MQRRIRTALWVGAALVIAGCAPSPKKVARVSIGNTGCPPGDLAVFGYVEETRSWRAACGGSLYVCSDVAGGTDCKPQDPQTLDPELAVRARALLSLPKGVRDRFVAVDVMEGDWDSFARMAAARAKLSDQQFEEVGFEGKLFTGFSAEFNQQLVQCLGQHGVLEVEVNDRGLIQIPKAGVKHRCRAKLLRSGELQQLRTPSTVRLLAANVFAVQALPRPEVATAESAKEPEPSGPTPEPRAPNPTVPKEGPGVEEEVRAWVDSVASDILACSNESKTAVLVELDEQGSATVSLRGALAGGAEEQCIRAAVGKKRFPSGPATVVHLVKPAS